MADVKISELTALTSPSGGEELVVNASGTTKKITITNATSASLPKAGGTMTGVIAGFESTGIDDNATSTAVTIDANENVGIGSTPATDWHSNYSVLQVGGQADIWTHKAVGAGKALHISHNAEYDTGFKFIANDEATLYVQADGAHRFSHGAYGTAGSAISFVERLKIDADGLTFQGNTGGAATALDDYEEGSGTPVVKYGTTTMSLHNGALARYVKIGSSVTYLFEFRISNTNSGGGDYTLALPFAMMDGGYAVGGLRIYNGAVAGGEFLGLHQNQSNLRFNRNRNNTSVTSITPTLNAYYYGSITYRTS